MEIVITIMQFIAVIAYIYAGWAVAFSILHEGDHPTVQASVVLICIIAWPLIILAVAIAFGIHEKQQRRRRRGGRR